MRRIALEDEYFIQRKFHPNVDFYSGIIYPAIGFKPEMFSVLFAIPAWRVGWRSDRRHSSPNCGALPRDLVESELFGCRRGAFTGAYADAPGLFVSGHRGMVFLDEVGEMPKDTQVKMLQVQQEKELRPVGSTKCVPVDVRIIAATNRLVADLRSECLREDLCFRIATVVIEIPPLRARPDDTQVLRSQP